MRRRHLEPGQRAAIAVEAKPLLAAEAKKNQQTHAGTAPGKAKNTSVNNDKSVPKPIDSRKEVASQFDVSQGYVYAAQKIREKDKGPQHERLPARPGEPNGERTRQGEK